MARPTSTFSTFSISSQRAGTDSGHEMRLCSDASASAGTIVRRTDKVFRSSLTPDSMRTAGRAITAATLLEIWILSTGEARWAPFLAALALLAGAAVYALSCYGAVVTVTAADIRYRRRGAEVVLPFGQIEHAGPFGTDVEPPRRLVLEGGGRRIVLLRREFRDFHVLAALVGLAWRKARSGQAEASKHRESEKGRQVQRRRHQGREELVFESRLTRGAGLLAGGALAGAGVAAGSAWFAATPLYLALALPALALALRIVRSCQGRTVSVKRTGVRLASPKEEVELAWVELARIERSRTASGKPVEIVLRCTDGRTFPLAARQFDDFEVLVSLLDVGLRKGQGTVRSYHDRRQGLSDHAGSGDDASLLALLRPTPVR